MTVRMIVAVDRDNAIGWYDGALPWKISGDLKRFKELTTHHTVIMGRKTFDSLKRPNGLPNRHNVVLTENRELANEPQSEPHYFAEKDALKTYCQVHQECLGCVPDDLWIIGGASIYNKAIELQLVNEIYLTAVDMQSGANVKLNFPLYDWQAFRTAQLKKSVEWFLIDIQTQRTDDGLTYTFIILRKK